MDQKPKIRTMVQVVMDNAKEKPNGKVVLTHPDGRKTSHASRKAAHKYASAMYSRGYRGLKEDTLEERAKWRSSSARMKNPEWTGDPDFDDDGRGRWKSKGDTKSEYGSISTRKKTRPNKIGSHKGKVGKRSAGMLKDKIKAALKRGYKRVDLPEETLDEVAPPGDKAERMVKHIKARYAKDGKLTKKEKAIAYATAWKAHNRGALEEVAGIHNKKTLDSYITKAVTAHGMVNTARRNSTGKEKEYWAKKEQNRKKGISRAMDRLDKLDEGLKSWLKDWKKSRDRKAKSKRIWNKTKEQLDAHDDYVRATKKQTAAQAKRIKSLGRRLFSTLEAEPFREPSKYMTKPKDIKEGSIKELVTGREENALSPEQRKQLADLKRRARQDKKQEKIKAKLSEMDNWDGKSHSPSFKLQKSQPLPGGGRRDTYRDTSKFAQIQQRNLERNRAENLARHKADPSPRPGRPGSEVQRFKGDW